MFRFTFQCKHCTNDYLKLSKRSIEIYIYNIRNTYKMVSFYHLNCVQAARCCISSKFIHRKIKYMVKKMCAVVKVSLEQCRKEKKRNKKKWRRRQQRNNNVSGKNSQLDSKFCARWYILVTFEKKKCTSLDEHILNGPFKTVIFFFSPKTYTSYNHPPHTANVNRFISCRTTCRFHFHIWLMEYLVSEWAMNGCNLYETITKHFAWLTFFHRNLYTKLMLKMSWSFQCMDELI